MHTSAGRPVPAAHVMLVAAARTDVATDAAGAFRITLAPGDYDLTIVAPGFAAATRRRIAIAAATSLDVALEPLDAGAPRTIGRVAIDGRLAPERGEVPAQTISRDELDAAGARLALDGIARVPSATIARSAGGNAAATAVVALRGPDPSETLVTLDGQVLNDSNTGDFDLSQFPVTPLAGIDVAEGLGPAENRAANTIGGVVGLRTLQPTRESHAAVVARTGAFGTTALAVQSTGSAGRLGYAFALDDAQARGFVNDAPAAVAGTPVRLGSATAARSTLATLVYDASPQTHARLRYFTLADRRDLSAAENAPATPPDDVSGGTFVGPGAAVATQGLRALLLSVETPLATGSLLASYAISGTTKTFAGGTSASPYDLEGDDRLGTLSLGWRRSDARTDVGVDGYVRGESLDERAAFAGDVQRQTARGAHGHVAFDATPRVRLALDAFLTRYSTFGTSRDARAGVTYDLGARDVLRASVGTGFRAPLLAERYVVPADVLTAGLPGSVDARCVAQNGDATERAEHVTAYELGYGRRLSRATTLDVSLYRTNLRDPIEIAYPLAAACPAPPAPPVVAAYAIPVNVGDVVYRGAALRLTHAAGAFALRAEYGLNAAFPRDLPAAVANPTSGTNLVAGQQFERVPLQTATFGARYVRAGTHVDAELVYKGRNNELDAGPYATLGAAVGRRAGDVDLTLAARNLTSAEAGRFTRLGAGLPYPTPFGTLPTDRYALEPAALDLVLTLRH